MKKFEFKNDEHISIVEIDEKKVSEMYFDVFDPNDKVIALDFEAISSVIHNEGDAGKEKYKNFFTDLGFYARGIPVTQSTTDEELKSEYDEIISKVKLAKLDQSIKQVEDMLTKLAKRLQGYNKILVWGIELEKSIANYMKQKNIIDDKHPLNNIIDLRDFVTSKDKKGRVSSHKGITIKSNYGNGKQGDNVILENNKAFFDNLATMEYGIDYDELSPSYISTAPVNKLSSSLDVVSALFTAHENNEPLDSSVAFTSRSMFVEINRQFSFMGYNKMDLVELKKYNIQDSETVMKFYKAVKCIATKYNK